MRLSKYSLDDSQAHDLTIALSLDLYFRGYDNCQSYMTRDNYSNRILVLEYEFKEDYLNPRDIDHFKYVTLEFVRSWIDENLDTNHKTQNDNYTSYA